VKEDFHQFILSKHQTKFMTAENSNNKNSAVKREKPWGRG